MKLVGKRKKEPARRGMAFNPGGSGEAALFALDTPWGTATLG